MAQLTTVISGGQTGADQAGLVVASRFGLKTGGWMPKGFRTLQGLRPDFGPKYGIKEHTSPEYAPRTEKNVQDSDGTVRLAVNFQTAGEVCTLKAILRHKKPYFDVDLSDPPPIREFIDWIEANNITILNVAGNSEETYAESHWRSYQYLTSTFFEMGMSLAIQAEEILSLLGSAGRDVVLCNENLQPIQKLILKRQE